ncbi:MAG: dihydropyrimidinase [Candidatus Eremiobacteraeota bacterium]|nr:dihydropyrimidinase [Candidatus Eremiobacteraeota bacterium]
MGDFVLKGGTVVTAGSLFSADVAVKGEKVAALGDIPGEENVLDVRGKLVLPGALDAHVHFHLPIGGGTYSADDFATGGRSAALGGVTTVFDFVHAGPGEEPLAALQARMAEARECPVDYGLFYCISEHTPSMETAVPELIRTGIASFKIYTTYRPAGIYLDDGGCARLLRLCAEHGGMASIHAENDTMIEAAIEEASENNELSPPWHGKTRPPFTEGEAIRRMAYLAKKTGAIIHIMHVSSGEGLGEVIRAQQEGIALTAETCPHYLLFDESKLEGPDGCLYTMTPPLRTPRDQSLLWEGLVNDHLQFVTTDHCPFTRAQKECSKDDFRKIPKGVGGVGTLVPLMYSEGTAMGRISIVKMVELLSENPARRYGLWPWKGALLPGSDADITVLAPEDSWVVTKDETGSAADYSIFSGMSLKGRIEQVYRRGSLLVDRGKYLPPASPGQFLPRRVMPGRTLKACSTGAF